MIAAMVLGEGVLPMPPDKPATFHLGIVMTAMVIHFMLAISYGLIGAAIVAHRMGYGAAIALGAAAGLATYLVNFYPVPRSIAGLRPSSGAARCGRRSTGFSITRSSGAVLTSAPSG